MKRICLLVDLFRTEADTAESEATLRRVLATLTNINMAWLRTHPNAPRLYQAGVHYVREPEGVENWQSIGVLLRRGRGDCEDLACARAAELNVRDGIRAKPAAVVRRDGNVWRYHIVVKYPDGIIEDPSKRLGM